MELRLLGPLEVVDGGRPLPLGGPRQRALLAILLLNANEVVSSDRLIDQLWGERPPRTAANTLQFYVSRLRKALGAERILTRAPGYALQVFDDDEVDLARFEHLVARGDRESLLEALALWRGPALADVADEPFARGEARRLEELRLVAIERRIDLDLELGRHRELVGELEILVAEHPLRERLCAQLMLALYRAGRHADALAVYRAANRALTHDLGLEPSPALRELEGKILRHDPSLAPAAPVTETKRAVLAVVQDESELDSLVDIGRVLARKPARELILAEIVDSSAALARASAALSAARDALAPTGVEARVAAFTSDDFGQEVVRLASEQDVDLILASAQRAVVEAGAFPAALRGLLAAAPCDVALLLGDVRAPLGDAPVFVPFSGAEHDWAAVEVAAWFALAQGAPLRMLGTEGDGEVRDASRMLARASLVVQRAVGVSAEPVLVPRGADAVLAAAEQAQLIVMGLSSRWQQEGLGEDRRVVAQRARAATLLVRGGIRPGGLAPETTLTRFSWTLGARDDGL